MLVFKKTLLILLIISLLVNGYLLKELYKTKSYGEVIAEGLFIRHFETLERLAIILELYLINPDDDKKGKLVALNEKNRSFCGIAGRDYFYLPVLSQNLFTLGYQTDKIMYLYFQNNNIFKEFSNEEIAQLKLFNDNLKIAVNEINQMLTVIRQSPDKSENMLKRLEPGVVERVSAVIELNKNIPILSDQL